MNAAVADPEDELDGYDALGLAGLVADGTVSAAELLERSIARAERLDPSLNFLAHRMYNRARDAVQRGLPEGPFRGVPLLVKDLNTHVAGEPTGQGSRSYDGYRATVTSEIVRRYEAAGLVVFGKTTSPEFGLTGTTESLATGITRNPWNPECIAGGSSGGAAAAVAAGVVPAAHATDGGGSIRIPASCCGLFGLKPSRGRVPMGPPRTEGWGGMSVHHAVTWSVRDSAALLDATCGEEPGARYGAPHPEGSFLSQVGRDPGRLRVALYTTPPSGSAVDPVCVRAAQDAATLLRSLGHHVEEAAPVIDARALGQATYVLIASSVAAAVDARAQATGIPPSRDILEAITLQFVEMGRGTSGIDVVRANEALQDAALAVSSLMDDWDILLSPTLAAPPPPVGTLGLSHEDLADWGARISGFIPFTGLFNATGQPSMSLPLAMSPEGLPIGVMATARYGDEAMLFRLAGQIEQAAPWRDRRPGRAMRDEVA